MTPDASEAAVLRLSVVVTAWSGPNELRRCLQSLASQLRPGADEIIVARNFPVEGGAPAKAAFSSGIDLAFSPETTVPHLRAAALTAASGDIVAFVEDHCICAPAWRNAILAAYALPRDAVGGPVDLGDGGNPLDWAVYFYDYGRFAPPMQSGTVGALSGANASYRRTFLDDPSLTGDAGLVETALERKLLGAGLRMHLAADAIVIYHGHQTPGHAISLAFNLARGFGAGRLAGASLAKRLMYAVATAILPVLLLTRIFGATSRSGRHRAQLFMSLPWLVVLLVAWSAGEFAGYLAGAGASQGHWR